MGAYLGSWANGVGEAAVAVSGADNRAGSEPVGEQAARILRDSSKASTKPKKAKKTNEAPSPEVDRTTNEHFVFDGSPPVVPPSQRAGSGALFAATELQPPEDTGLRKKSVAKRWAGIKDGERPAASVRDALAEHLEALREGHPDGPPPKSSMGKERLLDARRVRFLGGAMPFYDVANAARKIAKNDGELDFVADGILLADGSVALTSRTLESAAALALGATAIPVRLVANAQSHSNEELAELARSLNWVTQDSLAHPVRPEELELHLVDNLVEMGTEELKTHMRAHLDRLREKQKVEVEKFEPAAVGETQRAPVSIVRSAQLRLSYSHMMTKATEMAHRPKEFVSPAVVTPDGTLMITDANHRSGAAMALGAEHLDVQIIADCRGMSHDAFVEVAEEKGWGYFRNIGGDRPERVELLDHASLKDDPGRQWIALAGAKVELLDGEAVRFKQGTKSLTRKGWLKVGGSIGDEPVSRSFVEFILRDAVTGQVPRLEEEPPWHDKKALRVGLKEIKAALLEADLDLADLGVLLINLDEVNDETERRLAETVRALVDARQAKLEAS